MVKIVVPENIHINHQGADWEETFSNYVIATPLSDVKFGANYRTLLAAHRLWKEAKELRAGDEWEISDEDYTLLKNIVENPSKAYETKLALPFVVFMQAIVEPAVPLDAK